LLGRTFWGSILVGLTGGFAFYGIHIFWLTTYLGAVPWLALAGLQTIFFAIGAALIALAWRHGLRAWPESAKFGAASRLILLPVVLAGLWTLREAIVSVWPYGGFSWGRLAFSRSQSPLGDLVAWLGATGLSFVVALLAAMILQAVREAQFGGWQFASWRPLLMPAVAVILALAMPAWPTSVSGSIRVAAVQGDSDAGLFAQRERGDILDDHLQATVPVLDENVDLVVWPENAADLNPLDYPQAAGVLDFVTEEMDAPLVVGTITSDEVGRVFNSLLLWQPGDGAVAQYDKLHPVPFAEYLPDREFWYPLAPNLFDLVPRDYSFGQRPNVFDIELRDGTSLKAGLAICFDIVDDALLHQMVDGGADIILAPTNNADFGQSQESVQQLAIARLRAIEYGRSVVNTSTVGTSAIIAPDGSTIAELETFTPGVMLEDVPLSDTVTPASVIGRWVEWLVGLIGLGGLALAIVLTQRHGLRMPRA
ncbi:MAG TPA: apolipoprotein N-acyltransferase, partial [Homoserinimonas sp.]|nr:apolipoprotein N-acyltransferase [Homoserinimonas sp.]